MKKSYTAIGTNRRGECITCKFSSFARPNSNAWFKDFDEAADCQYYDVTFTHYNTITGGGKIRKRANR